MIFITPTMIFMKKLKTKVKKFFDSFFRVWNDFYYYLCLEWYIYYFLMFFEFCAKIYHKVVYYNVKAQEYETLYGFFYKLGSILVELYISTKFLIFTTIPRFIFKKTLYDKIFRIIISDFIIDFLLLDFGRKLAITIFKEFKDYLAFFLVYFFIFSYVLDAFFFLQIKLFLTFFVLNPIIFFLTFFLEDNIFSFLFFSILSFFFKFFYFFFYVPINFLFVSFLSFFCFFKKIIISFLKKILDIVLENLYYFNMFPWDPVLHEEFKLLKIRIKTFVIEFIKVYGAFLKLILCFFYNISFGLFFRIIFFPFRFCSFHIYNVFLLTPETYDKLCTLVLKIEKRPNFFDPSYWRFFYILEVAFLSILNIFNHILDYNRTFFSEKLAAFFNYLISNNDSGPVETPEMERPYTYGYQDKDIETTRYRRVQGDREEEFCGDTAPPYEFFYRYQHIKHLSCKEMCEENSPLFGLFFRHYYIPDPNYIDPLAGNLSAEEREKRVVSIGELKKKKINHPLIPHNPAGGYSCSEVYLQGLGENKVVGHNYSNTLWRTVYGHSYNNMAQFFSTGKKVTNENYNNMNLKNADTKLFLDTYQKLYPEPVDGAYPNGRDDRSQSEIDHERHIHIIFDQVRERTQMFKDTEAPYFRTSRYNLMHSPYIIEDNKVVVDENGNPIMRQIATPEMRERMNWYTDPLYYEPMFTGTKTENLYHFKTVFTPALSIFHMTKTAFFSIMLRLTGFFFGALTLFVLMCLDNLNVVVLWLHNFFGSALFFKLTFLIFPVVFSMFFLFFVFHLIYGYLHVFLLSYNKKNFLSFFKAKNGFIIISCLFLIKFSIFSAVVFFPFFKIFFTFQLVSAFFLFFNDICFFIFFLFFFCPFIYDCVLKIFHLGYKKVGIFLISVLCFILFLTLESHFVLLFIKTYGFEYNLKLTLLKAFIFEKFNYFSTPRSKFYIHFDFYDYYFEDYVYRYCYRPKNTNTYSLVRRVGVELRRTTPFIEQRHFLPHERTRVFWDVKHLSLYERTILSIKHFYWKYISGIF